MIQSSPQKIDQTRVKKLIQQEFPHAIVKRCSKFPTGLVSPTFKIELENPRKKIVIKVGELRHKVKIIKNNKILKVLIEQNIPAPKIFVERIYHGKFITIMSCLEGNAANTLYKKADQYLRKKILFNVGKTLKKIHSIKIPYFWISQKHDINNINEWKKWTKLRIQKYLLFSKEYIPTHFPFLERELNKFWTILKDSEIDFVPLHWDYHLGNLNVNTKGIVTGVFDFDNALKGHSLGDIGQTAYWLQFELNDKKNFKSFLNGYQKIFTQDELKMIRGYFLLHLLAVSRNIWDRQKELGWIIEKHKKILAELSKKPSGRFALPTL